LSGSATSERQHQQLIHDLTVDFGSRAAFDAGAALSQTHGNPLIDLLAQSATPYELARCFMRIESQFHLGHRTSFTITRGSMRVEHLPAFGQAPTVAESLFVCGAMCSMFARVQARNVSAFVIGSNRQTIGVWPTYQLTSDAAVEKPLSWQIRWSFAPEDPAEPTPPLVDQLRALVLLEPSRSWSVAEAAFEVGTSARTLQRRCQADRTTVEEVIANGRIDAATALLAGTTVPAGAIAVMCGFVDLPHLTRHFRRRYGEPPGRFRRQQLSTRRQAP
jgi:AraC-like DNA-binding protein